MTKLDALFQEHGQSVWVDNLKRSYITSGELQQLVDQGVRGVTSNPTIFQKAISGSDDYDEQFRSLAASMNVEEAYWEMVIDDITNAMDILRPVHEGSEGLDGYVSLEVSPAIAADTEMTTKMARQFHERLDSPNLMVKIPATPAGLPAIQAMVREKRNINVTLVFSLDRYEKVIDAYLEGLEASEGDLTHVASVASFFVSRVDTEVDRRLGQIGGDEALALRGKAAVAQAKLAYSLYREKFSGTRWEALAARGARVQRPLWASTSTKNPQYPDLLYVDTLIGPDTVNTMPDDTVRAFLDHGTVARTVDQNVDDARQIFERLEAVGIDMNDVATTLEQEGVNSFTKSFDELLQALSDKATALMDKS